MKIPKSIFFAIFGLALLGLAAGFRHNFSSAPANPVEIIDEVPFSIEPFNPVPEVRHWEEGNRTIYYFNWGVQMSGGYSLQFDGLQGQTIRLKALRPKPGEMAVQVITYPKLLLSLPQGDYDYQVTDEKNRVLDSFFKPNYTPLQLSIYVPDGDEIRQRTVLRDPSVYTKEKTKISIALEALFNQVEMLDFLEHEVTVENVTSSEITETVTVTMSPGYQQLDKDHQAELTQLITETVLANDQSVKKVEITIAPAFTGHL